ncbi:MAG: EAL domain-containing protein [Hydrogenophilales bacterium]|nr:EAL domain-containing protein [Hydrogenophilales bacterium]
MQRTILLVDDEHHVTEAITRVLRQDGYRILIANAPARALEMLAGEAVQVVLSDQRMPEMTGVELLSQVRERYPDTVRMVLSGHADLDSVIDAVNRGAVYKYLAKPWDNDALRATVHEAFHHHELQQQKAGLLREIELANQQLTGLNLELARGLEAKAEELARLANYDAVTGLPNRVLFSDRLHQALAHGERNASLVGLMLLDLDRFKYVNDSLGHPVGDELLHIIGERLQQALRSGDTVARGGGDEFMFVLNDLRDPSGAADIAQKLLECLSGAYQLAGSEVFMTGSIGISIYPNDGPDAVTLVKNADAALFHAKSEGRNNYQSYTGSMNASALKRLTLESALRRAVEREEFALLYQPQIDLISGRIIGVEALLRWNHPERGLVSPADFIPLLEETGLIVPVGEWVLRSACRQSRAWLDGGMPSIRMAVNLSALQFQQPDLVGMVAGILTENAIDPACQDLELELTESLIMRDVEKTIITLKQLHEMGVKLSIDDFGTGYSSLSYLKRFPISTLKIDQSFVRDLERNPDDAAIVAAVISLGHSLKMSVIAEGVETEAQLAYLRHAGCDEMQGYFFSRPVGAPEVETMIREGRRCAAWEG